MAQVDITPIQEEHLREVGEFLNVHLNSKFSADPWIQSLTHPCSATQPNSGAQLRDGAKLVGVHCAIYSDQTIEGRVEKFCNPHTWCVLGDYRNHGIGLVLYLIKQRGYHFTMLTPNPKVAEIFRKLKFKDLDTGIAVFFNLPTLRIRREVIVESDKASIAQYLPPAVRRDYELHREIPWLRFLAFGRGEDVCLVVYKTDRWKRMSCARIIHVSDPA